jgi:flagellar biogenesis protein FliO
MRHNRNRSPWNRCHFRLSLTVIVAVFVLTTHVLGQADDESDLGSSFVVPALHGQAHLVTRPLPASRGAQAANAPIDSPQRNDRNVATSPRQQTDSQNEKSHVEPTPPPPTRSKSSNSAALPLRSPSEVSDVLVHDRTRTHVSVIIKSLALVLGLFFGALWVARRAGLRPKRASETGVFEMLGQFPLANRRTATIVKFGQRLLVFAESPRGIEKLTEMSDPAEVEQVMAMCQRPLGGAQVGTVQDWLRDRGLQSGITSEITRNATA